MKKIFLSQRTTSSEKSPKNSSEESSFFEDFEQGGGIYRGPNVSKDSPSSCLGICPQSHRENHDSKTWGEAVFLSFK